MVTEKAMLIWRDERATPMDVLVASAVPRVDEEVLKEDVEMAM